MQQHLISRKAGGHIVIGDARVPQAVIRITQIQGDLVFLTVDSHLPVIHGEAADRAAQILNHQDRKLAA